MKMSQFVVCEYIYNNKYVKYNNLRQNRHQLISRFEGECRASADCQLRLNSVRYNVDSVYLSILYLLNIIRIP